MTDAVFDFPDPDFPVTKPRPVSSSTTGSHSSEPSSVSPTRISRCSLTAVPPRGNTTRSYISTLRTRTLEYWPRETVRIVVVGTDRCLSVPSHPQQGRGRAETCCISCGVSACLQTHLWNSFHCFHCVECLQCVDIRDSVVSTPVTTSRSGSVRTGRRTQRMFTPCKNSPQFTLCQMRSRGRCRSVRSVRATVATVDRVRCRDGFHIVRRVHCLHCVDSSNCLILIATLEYPPLRH